MMKKSNWVLIVAAIIVIGFVVVFFLRGNEDSWIKDESSDWIRHGNPGNVPEEVLNDIDSFASCSKAGFPILETYPEQCKLPNGKSFTRDIGQAIQ